METSKRLLLLECESHARISELDLQYFTCTPYWARYQDR